MTKTQSKTRYTPGPWRVGGYHGEHGESGAFIKATGGTIVADTRPLSSAAQTDANADLIAQAPAMAEALRGLLEVTAEYEADESMQAAWSYAERVLRDAGVEV